ncbi:MAG: hypothetical protein WA294_21685 [Acidobacteriaceae bacterium]
MTVPSNERTERMEAALFRWIMALIVVLLIVVAFKLRWAGINMKVDPTTVSTILAPLLLTALFIERAVEVIVSAWRDEGADQRANAVKTAKRSAAAIATQDAAVGELTRYKGKTKRYALALALVLGASAAIVGVRALWPFVDDANGKFAAASIVTDKTSGKSTENPSVGNPINADENKDLKSAFITVDILLSALLLAGGASGIHSIMSAFTSFFDATAQKNQQASDKAGGTGTVS